MSRICILLLCVAFFALIDAQPTLNRLGDSKKNSAFIKLNDPSFVQSVLNKIKKPLDKVKNLIKNNDVPSKKGCIPNDPTSCCSCTVRGKKEDRQQKRTKLNKNTNM
uniref:Secreted protein n=1 Tax=Hydra oligactis TaxID=6088 RepID=B3VQ06_HYDOL|nr:secreted protein [Hydra oligactis]